MDIRAALHYQHPHQHHQWFPCQPNLYCYLPQASPWEHTQGRCDGQQTTKQEWETSWRAYSFFWAWALAFFKSSTLTYLKRSSQSGIKLPFWHLTMGNRGHEFHHGCSTPLEGGISRIKLRHIGISLSLSLSLSISVISASKLHSIHERHHLLVLSCLLSERVELSLYNRLRGNGL